MKSRIMVQHQIYNLLNPNQKVKFQAMMEEKEQKNMEMKPMPNNK